MKMTEMNQSTEPSPTAHDMSAINGMEGMGAKPKLSTLNLVIVSLLSMAMLATGFALAAHYGDPSIRAGEASMKMPMNAQPMDAQTTKGKPSAKPMTGNMKGMKMPATETAIH